MTLPESALRQKGSSQEITEEVEKLASYVRSLEKVATPAGFIGAAVGSIMAIPLGPFFFAAGAAIGAAVVGALRVYSTVRKKELDKKISLLLANGSIPENLAEELRAKLDSIHTDDPNKQKPSAIGREQLSNE